MTRILIAGLKEPPGGVESAVLAYTDNFSTDEITTDFAFICETVSFENRIKNGQALYLPNRIKHPVLYRKRLKDIFSEGNYDALWCNYSGLTNIDFLKAAKKAGVKTRIIHAHTAKLSWGNIVMKYLVPFFHNKNQKIIDRYATDFWACSAKSAEFMYGKRIAEKTTIIPNGVDIGKFFKDEKTKKDVCLEFNLPEDSIIIGHIGRMCSEKNQTFLLDILQEAVKLNEKVKLLFVGDGELRESVMNYASEISVTDSVIFTLSRKDIPRLLCAADVFLLPSLTEGFPVTVVEAQAADVPCVVSSEAVVKEADLTGSITFVSLERSAAEWAVETLKASEKTLKNGKAILKEKGFDCKTEAAKIQQFFKGDKTVL